MKNQSMNLITATLSVAITTTVFAQNSAIFPENNDDSSKVVDDVFVHNNTLQQIQTPEKIAQAYFEAIHQNRLEDLVQYFHPQELDKIRNMLLPVAKRVDRVGKRTDLFLSLFDGVKNIKMLTKLDSQDFFLAYYKQTIKRIPYHQLLKNTKTQIIGYVTEGHNFAHVVCRHNTVVKGKNLTNLSLLSLQQDKSGWRILLTSEIEGMANMLKQRFSE